MIEITKNVYVGNQDDALYGWKDKSKWAFVHACKDPWHREFVGYTTQGAPKDSPEFYYAVRGNEIALNIVDVDNSLWFNIDMIKTALGFIASHQDYRSVLIHCNQGESRSPSIGLLYLAIMFEIPNSTFEVAERAFMKIYKNYNPKRGIREHIKQNWQEYITGV